VHRRGGGRGGILRGDDGHPTKVPNTAGIG
jgi:hypothetical protein